LFCDDVDVFAATVTLHFMLHYILHFDVASVKTTITVNNYYGCLN